MTNHPSRSWKFRVVKSQRDGQGKWFSYRGHAFADESAAMDYAERFAREQTDAGVVGTRINILSRRGDSIAEFRVNP